jgi:hypothetical protein
VATPRRSTAPATAGRFRQVNPPAGAFVWQTGRTCAGMGTPTLDSAGVLAAGTYTCPTGKAAGAFLINASTGTLLITLPTGTSKVFGQPVSAQGTLFVATLTNGLYSFAP